MSRNLKLYFEDILNSCYKIIRYTEGLEYEEFIKDDLRLDAVLRNIQIIGNVTHNRSRNSAESYQNSYFSSICDIVVQMN